MVTLVIIPHKNLAQVKEPVLQLNEGTLKLQPAKGHWGKVYKQGTVFSATVVEDGTTIGSAKWWYTGNGLTIRMTYTNVQNYAGVTWAAVKPLYGLGDHGSYLQQAALEEVMIDSMAAIAKTHGDGERFISTFTIAPTKGLAWCVSGWGKEWNVLDPTIKYVHYTGNRHSMGVRHATDVELTFWADAVPKLYSGLHSLALKKGWKIPYNKETLQPWIYELGYEAFGSLGWNTNQHDLIQDLKHYLVEGYPLKWVVLGSGFWPGIRRDSTEGTTNSFGLWDTLPHADGSHARYPNPKRLKQWLDSAGLRLLLGMRTDFKALPEAGGNYRPQNDGPFTLIAQKKGYLVGQRGPHTQPNNYISHFPRGPVWLLECRNDSAVNSFIKALETWQVQGFKEDVMFKSGALWPQDAKLNPIYNKLVTKGYGVMTRNGYNAVSGHLIRLEDTGFTLDQDRPIINALAYAASGAGLVYPDIIGGKYLKLPLSVEQKAYIMMNLRWMPFCPGYSVGLGLWHLDSAQQVEAKTILNWRAKHESYFLEQIIKTHKTGYPHAMTPLHIAFPKWDYAHEMASKNKGQWGWMVGPKLLVLPLAGQDYATVQYRNYVLPPGLWKSEATGTVHKGGNTVTVTTWNNALFWKVESR